MTTTVLESLTFYYTTEDETNLHIVLFIYIV